jgi:GNAT superfamily N-acetyltransferase
VHLAEDGTGRALGTYYLRANAGGGGAHVCNCGYITAGDARGQGVARAMLDHSLDRGAAAGVSRDAVQFRRGDEPRAVETWTRAGFAPWGGCRARSAIPGGAIVDALVMWKDLTMGVNRRRSPRVLPLMLCGRPHPIRF